MFHVSASKNYRDCYISSEEMKYYPFVYFSKAKKNIVTCYFGTYFDLRINIEPHGVSRTPYINILLNKHN